MFRFLNIECVDATFSLGYLELKLEYILHTGQFSDVVVLHLRKIFENFGLSLEIPCDCSYNTGP